MTTQITQGALMGPEGVEPRFELTQEQEARQMDQEIFDPKINSEPLEVYMYYAAIERAHEDADERPIPDAPWSMIIKTLTGRKHKIVHAHEQIDKPSEPPMESVRRFFRGGRDKDEKQLAASTSSSGPKSPLRFFNRGKDKDEKHDSDVTVGSPADDDFLDTTKERETAYHLLRIASWQVVFYLITTDILGFSSSPKAFGQLGYGPGMLVYTFFFILAFLSGQILWRIYLDTDSRVYPITCYADLGERTFGRIVRHVFNFLQSLQLLMNVAILIIGNGQTLATIIKFKFCYIALNVFWALAGMVIGQIKSLRSFGWFTNINIWLNIIVMVITMAGTAIYPPVPAQSDHKDLSQPIRKFGWVPPPSYTGGTGAGWYEQVSGVQYAVFAYGGAMIFTEFMAEMRRPRDFWKAALCAQLFCYLMYIFFGLFCYSYQGQYVSILPSLNFDNTALQLVCNIIGLVSTGVATVLYANIGVKVFYHNVLRAYFKAPPITSKRGSFYWVFLVIGYWCICWVIGCAVPNISALVTLVGAACILQFTYTFPPLLLLGWWIQKDAIEGDHPWQPGMAPWSNRIDSWRNKSRWKRGFRKYWYAKVFLIIIFLAALALAALGIYAGVEKAIQAYATDSTTAFSCNAPGQT